MSNINTDKMYLYNFKTQSKVYIISGFAGTGKSTAADKIQQYANV